MSAQQSELAGKRAYHAAELFHLPARLFNEKLVFDLESLGFNVFSPQRDGFEFTQLGTTLAKYLPPEEIGKAINHIIFPYDVYSIYKSDVVIARYDEPSDPGVIDEVLIANALGIPAVIYRTDVRSPYGSFKDPDRGMHTFPINTSQVMILTYPGAGSTENELHDLAVQLVRAIEVELNKHPATPPKSIPDFLKPTFNVIDILFKGIKDIHSPEGLEELAKRYQSHQKELENLGPRWVR